MTGDKKISIDDRKETKLIVLMSVIIFGVIALGLSYAFFEASISKGGLAGDVTCFDVEYLKGGNITGNLKPLDEGEDYITNGAVAQVTMHTTCTGSNLIGTLYFTTEPSSTFEFETGYLKYAVVTGGNTVATGSIDGTENQVIYDGFTLNRSATVYKVYFWLDGNYKVTSDKTLSGFIHAEAILESDVKPGPAKLTLNHLRSLGFEGTVSTNSPTTFTSTATTDEGLFASEDDLGTSYYFRGAVENNYVKFGKNSSNQDMYWRIIRINGDGTIRMIYDGTQIHANGISSSDRSVGYGAYNSSREDNGFIGYMNGTTDEINFPNGTANSISYEEAHSNLTNSKIKTYLEGTDSTDGWYKDNIVDTGYSQYIADAIYCNSRVKEPENYQYADGTIYENLGFGIDATNYGIFAYPVGIWDAEWNMISVTPSLKCERQDDRFTVEKKIENIGGNSKNRYPVGLITVDEAIFAGGYNESNNKYYLYTGSNYWTMSPGYYDLRAMISIVGNDGIVDAESAHNKTTGVRPVISLKADAIKSGVGTADNPFSIYNAADQTVIYLKSLGFEGTVSETEPTTLLTGATTDEGLFAAEDDQGTSYYFRGNVTNNYVKFGKYTEDAYAIYDWDTGTSSYASTCSSNCTQIAAANDDMYWRIVRINGDGTIRMIYDGTSPHTNGTSSTNRQVGKSMYNYNRDDNAYVGYMYGKTGDDSTYAETHENTNDSSIKTTIDRWYLKYLNTNYGSNIANAIYCNDRKIVTDDNKYKAWWEDDTMVAGTGIGASETMYGTWNRMESTDNYYNLSEVNPSLKCEQVNDRFTLQGELITTIDGLGGNQDLTYPVGLITADETILAGGSWANNSNYYLYTGNTYWTGSASDVNGGYARAFYVNSDGDAPINNYVRYDGGVRPAISLKADSIKSGNGTSGNPFRISAE